MQFEVDLIVNLQKIASKGLTTFFEIMSLVGSYIGFAALIIAMLFVSKKLAATFGICFLGGVGFNYVLKHLIDRPRPFVSHPEIINLTQTLGESMPSSHALCAVTIAIFLFYFVWRFTTKLWARILAAAGGSVIVVLTCMARLYLGMHYLTDLLVGILIGTLICIVGICIMEKKEKNARIYFKK